MKYRFAILLSFVLVGSSFVSAQVDEQSAGSWAVANETYRFRHKSGGFLLIGADRSDYERNDSWVYKSSYNFLTRKVKDVEKIREGLATPVGERPSVFWRMLPSKELKNLKELGPAFSCDFEADTAN